MLNLLVCKETARLEKVNILWTDYYLLCVAVECGFSTQSEWLLVSAEYPIYLEPWGNMPFYRERSEHSSFWLIRACEWAAPYRHTLFNVSLVCPTGHRNPALQVFQVMYFFQAHQALQMGPQKQLQGTQV